MITHTLGAVLAGGSSSRMGSDKAALTYLDIPFIDHVVGTLSVVLRDVVVCGGSYAGPLEVLADPIPDAGPLAGILAALEHAAGRPVFVCAVDLPLVSASLVSSLVEPEMSAAAARVAIQSDDGTVQPLCGVYGPGVGDLIRTRLDRGHRSVFGLLAELDVVEHVPVDPHTLTNVNTPQDLALLEPRGLT
jgi:molybdopterin-guanine dinucleotide biosynthesis protein A